MRGDRERGADEQPVEVPQRRRLEPRRLPETAALLRACDAARADRRHQLLCSSPTAGAMTTAAGGRRVGLLR